MSHLCKEVIEEIRRTLLEAEYRSHSSRAFKAAYFLYNETTDIEFSLDELAYAADCSRSEIPKALWNLLMGYETLSKSNPRYLAPIHEKWLADLCEQMKNLKTPLTREEILLRV